MSMPIKPQNAKKADSVAEAIAKCESPMMEPKFDGWRFLVWIDEMRLPHVFSRTGKLYTNQTPAPILQELMLMPPDTILDGEMVDITDNKNCTAATNVFGKSKATPSQEEQDRISYIVFDMPRMHGDSIESMPLADRRHAIANLFEIGGFSRTALTPQFEATEAVYHALLDEGYEGAMVKDNAASYAAGKRGWGWFKLKDTAEIDVVVMSMELDGKGQHTGKVGKFVVGQYAEGELIERARVNPYDDAMRNAMTRAAESKTNEFLGRVLTIKHYGVLVDGLRHPVFVRWREDKPAEDCGFHNG